MSTAKQPKTGYKEPQALVSLSKQIQAFSMMAHPLAQLRRDIVRAHKNIPALRQKTWEDGIPGSNEPFVTPIIALEDGIEETIRFLQNMKADCAQLRNTDPENWA